MGGGYFEVIILIVNIFIILVFFDIGEIFLRCSNEFFLVLRILYFVLIFLGCFKWNGNFVLSCLFKCFVDGKENVFLNSVDVMLVICVILDGEDVDDGRKFLELRKWKLSFYL